MSPSPHCPAEVLSSFLDDSLSPQQTRTIEKHLETCELCRHELEKESGEQTFWSSVAALSDDELDRDWVGFGQFSSSETSHSDGAEGNPTQQRETRLRAVFESIKHQLAPTDDPQSVGRIGAYEITGMIGCGGMGIVLKAKDPLLERVVAIKMLAPHLAVFEKEKLRFQREAKAAAAVQHDGIIPIYGVDTHQGTPYFVMPYEAGPSLQQRIENDGKLSIEESLRVAAQIAAALASAHQSGLVHRDIKPSNILLAPGTERALLTDFGLAQAGPGLGLTATGLLAGTPMFMSPEQARGEQVDSRSDLFSLGSVLFMMLTGNPPVTGETTYSIVSKVGGDPMPRLRDIDNALPVWLDRFVNHLHQRDKENRIQTAHEVMVLLNECLAHLQNPAERSIPLSLLPLEKTGNAGFKTIWIWGGVVLAFAAVLLVGSMGGLWPSSQSTTKPQPPPAQQAPLLNGGSNSDETAFDPTLEWDDGLDATLDEIRHRISILENETIEADEAIIKTDKEELDEKN